MPPIDTTLAQQRERAFMGFTVDANTKRLKLAVQMIERSQPVGALSEIGLELRVEIVDDAGVHSHAAEQQKQARGRLGILAADDSQRHFVGSRFRKQRRRFVRLHGNARLLGQQVRGACGQGKQRDARVANTADNLIESAVAATRGDQVAATGNGLLGQANCVALGLGGHLLHTGDPLLKDFPCPLDSFLAENLSTTRGGVVDQRAVLIAVRAQFL